MERQRRQQQDAAAVLCGALIYLNRTGLCKEPISAAMFVRPNLKGLQAVLYLLHYRIRGAARTKKDLHHIYPVLEPGQAREFKAAMHEWIRELGAAGLVLPDTVKYFVTGYQGSHSHRTVLMLLDLSTVALARDLGQGPHASLEHVQLVQPHQAAVQGRLLRGTQQAASAAQRELQCRMDEVVAAMQRLKQLQAQAAGHMVAGRATPGAVAAKLAPRVPPLFSHSQTAIKRGELVQQLLSQGPTLTAQPEAVRPDSWEDLLTAGRSTTAASDVVQTAVSASASAARRLSNPAQEASNFAAESMAADADVITVHNVLVRRLAAAHAAVRASLDDAAAPESPAVWAALAEAAAYRESLLVSVRQELAAAQIRAEQRAPQDAGSSGGKRISLLQLLPPSSTPCNPVSEGLQLAQEVVAASAMPCTPTQGSSWATPQAAVVQAVRRAMWQQAEEECAGKGTSRQPEVGSTPGSPGASTDGGAGEGVAVEPASPYLPDGVEADAAEAGSSTSKAAPGARQRAGWRISSPSLADILSHSTGLADMPLLSEGLGERRGTDLDCLPSPLQPVLSGQHGQQHHHQRRQQPQPGSPCMAESCASASVVGDSHAQRSNSSSAATGAAVARRQGSGSMPLSLAASPMLSAAASFMPPRRQHWEAQGHSVEGQGHSGHSGQLQATSDGSLQQQGGAPGDSEAGASSPADPMQVASSGDWVVGSPAADAGAGAVPWRQAALVAGASAGAASSPTANSSRRRAVSIAFTLTPPKRLAEDSPQQAVEQQRQQADRQPHVFHSRREQQVVAAFDSPVRDLANASGASSSGSGEATPVSKLFGAGMDSPAASPVLQPNSQQQQQQHHAVPRLRLGSSSGGGSPGDYLLASCLKSKCATLPPSPFSSPAVLDKQELLVLGGAPGRQAGDQWTLAAAPSTSPASTPMPARLDTSPLLSSRSGRRRSAALHTTSSPAGQQQLHRLASGVSAGSPCGSLLDSPRPLGTPGSHCMSLPRRAAAERASGEQQVARTAASGMLTPPRSLMATPETMGPFGRTRVTLGGGVGDAGESSAAQAGAADGGSPSIEALMQRFKLLPLRAPR